MIQKFLFSVLVIPLRLLAVERLTLNMTQEKLQRQFYSTLYDL